MTNFSLDLHFQPLHTAEQVLSAIYTPASDAIEQHGLMDSYCYMFIPKSKKVKVFAKVTIDAITNDVQYFVAKNPKTGDILPALSYNQALSTLRSLLA